MNSQLRRGGNKTFPVNDGIEIRIGFPVLGSREHLVKIVSDSKTVRCAPPEERIPILIPFPGPVTVSAVKDTGGINRSIGKLFHGDVEVLQFRNMFSGRSGVQEADADEPFTEFESTEHNAIRTAAGDHHLVGRWKRETEPFQIKFSFFNGKTDLRRTGWGFAILSGAFIEILLHKHGGFQTCLVFIRHKLNNTLTIFDNGESLSRCLCCKYQRKQGYCKKNFFERNHSLTSMQGFLISITGICSPGLIPPVPETTTT